MGLAWWLAGLLCFVSSIGIPFAIRQLKLAGIALAPIGKTLVAKEVAEAARARNAAASLDGMPR